MTQSDVALALLFIVGYLLGALHIHEQLVRYIQWGSEAMLERNYPIDLVEAKRAEKLDCLPFYCLLWPLTVGVLAAIFVIALAEIDEGA